MGSPRLRKRKGTGTILSEIQGLKVRSWWWTGGEEQFGGSQFSTLVCGGLGASLVYA